MPPWQRLEQVSSLMTNCGLDSALIGNHALDSCAGGLDSVLIGYHALGCVLVGCHMPG